jgi:hypothetical protein
MMRTWWLWVVSLAIACGGKVRFEGQGSGANGEGAGSSGTACEDYCDALAACPEVPLDCITTCENGKSSFPAECEGAFDALLRCYSDEPSLCAPDGSECLSEGFALASCIESGFGGGFADDGFDDGSSGSGFGGFSP